MPSGERSLVRQVGWTAAVCALIASATTLGVAVIVTDRQVIAATKAATLDRARSLLRELETEAEKGQKDIAEEIKEFTHGGFAIAVDRAGVMVAGSRDVPRKPDDGCAFRDRDGVTWLVCAVSGRLGHHVRVGTFRSRVLVHRRALLVGGVASLVVVALGSVLAGLLVARWSLRPLAGFGEVLEELKGKAATAERALPRYGLAEVDLIAATLDDLFSQLRQEVVRSRNFAADAAHELRTPLTKLRTELELVLESGTLGAPDAERVSALVKRTADLAQLVDRLLMLASPREALRAPTLVSLAATLSAVAEELEPDRVELEVQDDGLVTGDATVLGSMVRNALDNALKFSAGSVHASVIRAGDEIVIRVDDTGPGLDPEHREAVFDPFFRAPADRATAGHGVGLSLIAHVVAAHQGKVAFVDGAPGAHLEIRLPVAAPVAAPV